MAALYWGHGFGFGFVAGLVWLAVVAYLLLLATRLVRAIERIATKFEAKP
jgi:heme exporter protein D